MADWYWKQHDSAPAIQGTCADFANSPKNITGATVKFIMRAVGATSPKVNAAATVVNASTGVVRYNPTSVDTNSAGDFEAEWEVTYGDGTKQTFPNPAYVSITITADLDNA